MELTCTVLSAMFSFGSTRPYSLDKQPPEPRPSELKGLLRNTYRIANPSQSISALYKSEMILFGGQMKTSSDKIVTNSSPLRLQMIEKEPDNKPESTYLMLHKKCPRRMAYFKGKKFQIIFSVANNRRDELFTNVGTNPDLWYKDLLLLALIIGGIGKRSRRGRGCMTVSTFNDNISRYELLQWITIHLNKINKKNVYEIKNDCISLKDERITIGDINSDSYKKPFIQKIRFGKIVKDVNSYLKCVDNASHKIKCKPNGKNYIFATGFTIKTSRFASSVIVSLTKTSDGILPVYTILSAIYKKSYIRNAREEQNNFINFIENGDNE